MRSMPPTVLMYLAMMSSAVCADSGRAKSASPASLRRVFRMGSPRRDTVFDSGSPKIVVFGAPPGGPRLLRSEEHTSELQSQSNLVCRLLLEKKKKKTQQTNDK